MDADLLAHLTEGEGERLRLAAAAPDAFVCAVDPRDVIADLTALAEARRDKAVAEKTLEFLALMWGTADCKETAAAGGICIGAREIMEKRIDRARRKARSELGLESPHED